MFPLRFDVAGTTVDVPVHTLLNAGYAGRSQDDVAAHVAELAERLDVDERTVRRYVGHLLDLDIPVRSVRGRQ